jgi:hypothetical protein
MKESVRTALFFAAAALMLLGAAGNALVVIPDLHGDLVELGVRRTVLGGSVLLFYFSAMAMFGFAAMVVAAAIQSMRSIAPARLPLTIVAIIQVSFGLLALASSRRYSPHQLGTLAMGVLLAVALAIPSSKKSLTSPLPAAGPRRAS